MRAVMRAVMRDMQPPIPNDQELAGYIAGLERFNDIVAAREAALFASQSDPERLEETRHELHRVYRLPKTPGHPRRHRRLSTATW